MTKIKRATPAVDCIDQVRKGLRYSHAEGVDIF